VLRFEKGESADFGVILSNADGEEYRIGFDGRTNMFYSDRRNAGDSSFSESFANRVHRAPRTSADETIEMRIFFDVASAELFADGGRVVLTDIFFPTTPFDRIAVYSRNGRAKLLDGKVTRLNAIW